MGRWCDPSSICLVPSRSHAKPWHDARAFRVYGDIKVLQPLEVIETLLPGLTDKQRDQVAKQLRLSPCERSGHNFRPCGVIIRWILPPQMKVVCTKCGQRKVV